VKLLRDIATYISADGDLQQLFITEHYTRLWYRHLNTHNNTSIPAYVEKAVKTDLCAGQRILIGRRNLG
jgi:hypothetical protein